MPNGRVITYQAEHKLACHVDWPAHGGCMTDAPDLVGKGHHVPSPVWDLHIHIIVARRPEGTSDMSLCVMYTP